MKTFIRISSVMILSIVMLFPMSSSAQWGRNRIISPEVNDDHSVTFRLYAPNADKVEISGNWMTGWGAREEITPNDTGLYVLTVEPLLSEMYTYTFFVNGVKTLDPNNAITVRDGVNNQSMFLVPGEVADNYLSKDVPHGVLSKVWYPSSVIGYDRRLYVYTPPGYGQSKKKYPVFYLLHGAGGDEDAWTTLGRTPYILDNLIAAGKAEPMIVVMTNGNPTSAAAPGDDPVNKRDPVFQSSGPGGMISGKFEESLVKDVVPFIEKNYRVYTDREHRAIAGLSMGGFHTQNITNSNPGMFDYIGVMSMGKWDATRFGGPDNTAELRAQITLLKKSGVKLYWIGCGKEDFLYDSVTELRKFYDELEFPYVYRESSGGHTWTNWRIYLTELAPQLFK